VPVFPDIAYKFAQFTDTSGPTVEIYSRFLVGTATAAQVTVSFNGVAKDRVLVLTSVVVAGIPTSTETIDRLNVSVVTPSGVSLAIIEANFLDVATQRRSYTWVGQVYIGGAGVDVAMINFTGNFDAAVASKSIRCSAHGIVIPRGNIAPY